MNELKIELRPARTNFAPGEELAGMASWILDQTPRAMEQRLFWFTKGAGNEDVGVVETVRFDHPAAQESRPFRLRLPESPYSFSGKLITLAWALELVAEPSQTVARADIVVAPNGREVQLQAASETPTPE